MRPLTPHERMRLQALERRETGRPLQVGDFVQDGIGGQVREVVWAQNAGDFMEVLAERRVTTARENKGHEERG